MSLHLVIGNKNYSSWSFRPWLAMKVAGIRFDETVGSLDAADFKTRVTVLGGAGRVPVLSDGDVRVWESLAILEYLAEKFPAARLWPERPAARAHGSRDCIKDACRICFAAASLADECRAAGEIPGSRCRRRQGCGAHRCDLG